LIWRVKWKFIIIIIINKFENNIITIEEKLYIWFKGIKNYKNLVRRV
jgi:hypothetical protein